MKTNKGFTLIELLIVIAIIGILAVAFLPQLLGAPAKARDTQRLADLKKLEAFLVDHSLTAGSLPDTGCIGGPAPSSTDGDAGKLVTDSIAEFSGNIPADPDPSSLTETCAGGYAYVKYTAGLTYSAVLYANVENIGNANYNCSDAPDEATDFSGIMTEAEIDAIANNVPCHVVLIQ